MVFRDDNDSPVGMYDYGASDHPIHGDDEAAAALFELSLLARREAQVRVRIVELTCALRPAAQPTSDTATCLSAYRAARRRMGSTP